MGQPVNYLAGLGPLPDPAADLQNAIAFKVGLDREKLNQQLGELQVQEAQRKAEQQRIFEEDVRGIGENPTADNISQLILKHPQLERQIKSAWDVKSDAAKTADLTALSSIYNLGLSKDWDRAAQMARTRFEADKKAGQADDREEMIIQMLESGDDGQRKTALALIGSQVAGVVGPAHFSSVFSTIQDGGLKSAGPGSIVYDRDGNVRLEVPFAPRPLEVGPGKKYIEYRPGQGGTGGTDAPYTGGWTPRKRNGGDNDDAAVDGKISGAAAFMQVGPDADLSAEDPMKIAQAMALSEGGPGSLADRNNNPANLRNADGSFMKFPTKEAGLKAAAALVQRKLKNGQTTLRSLIEGLPAGGRRQSNVIADGGPPVKKPPTPTETRSLNGVIYQKINGRWYRKNS